MVLLVAEVVVVVPVHRNSYPILRAFAIELLVVLFSHGSYQRLRGQFLELPVVVLDDSQWLVVVVAVVGSVVLRCWLVVVVAVVLVIDAVEVLVDVGSMVVAEDMVVVDALVDEGSVVHLKPLLTVRNGAPETTHAG